MSDDNNIINLKSNGKIYPTTVLTNYKKYTLEQLEIKEGVDACNEVRTNEKQSLKKYQQFIVDFMSSEHNNECLLYYGVGSGKSAIVVSLFNELFNRSQNINLFFLIKAAHHNHPWKKEISKWLAKTDTDTRWSRIHFIHYDSPFFEVEFLNEVKKTDITYKNMFVIDESHNFIRNVYSNVVTQKGKRALTVYEYLVNEKKQNPQTKLLLLSATPAINVPFELALTFNLLRDGIFPKNEMLFNQLYIEPVNGISQLKRDMKNTFQRRILGLVSYYIGSEASPELFASKTNHTIDVQMSSYQTEIYNYFAEIERRIAISAQQSGRKQQNITNYTRQVANFAYPFIDDKYNGQNRPRPSSFKVSEHELEKLFQSKDLDKIKSTMAKQQMSQYANVIAQWETRLEHYFDQLYEQDKKIGRTIENDLKKFDDYLTADEYIKDDNEKSTLMAEMIDCSAKFVSIIFYLSKSELPVLIYSNNIIMEGINVIKIYLKYFGYRSFKDKGSTDFHRYGEFHGMIDENTRREAIEIENKPENRYGKLIKIMIFSSAASEGISLSNIGQVLITEPYWHHVRILQIIGRSLRLCGHANLPMDERHVDIYFFRSVKNNVVIKKTIENQVEKVETIIITDERKLQTIDFDVENVAKEKVILLESFYEPIKEVAFDCELFKAHNMIQTKYRCFKFSDNSLFKTNIGASYRDDLVDDAKISDGLNSVNSVILKIKVLKITGVYERDGKKHEDFFWYDPVLGRIYDYTLHFVVGKVKVDENEMVVKTGKSVYEVELIEVPIIKEVRKKK